MALPQPQSQQQPMQKTNKQPVSKLDSSKNQTLSVQPESVKKGAAALSIKNSLFIQPQQPYTQRNTA
jgi:hypothetical protein